MHVWLSYMNILHHMLKQEAFSRLSNMKNIFTPEVWKHNCTSSLNSAFYKVWLWPFAAISLACYELFEKYLVTLLHSSEAMQSVPLLFWVDMTWNFSAHFCSSRARVVSGRWSWGRRATNVLHDVPDDDRGCLKLILLTATHSMWRRLHIYVIHIIGPHVVPFSSELYYCR